MYYRNLQKVTVQVLQHFSAVVDSPRCAALLPITSLSCSHINLFALASQLVVVRKLLAQGGVAEGHALRLAQPRPSSSPFGAWRMWADFTAATGRCPALAAAGRSAPGGLPSRPSALRKVHETPQPVPRTSQAIHDAASGNNRSNKNALAAAAQPRHPPGTDTPRAPPQRPPPPQPSRGPPRPAGDFQSQQSFPYKKETRQPATRARYSDTASTDGREAYGSSTRTAVLPSSSQGPDLPEVHFISSASNNYVKHLVRLRSNVSYRREVRRGLLVGAELLQEVAGDSPSPLHVRVLLLPEGAPPLPPGTRVVADRVLEVSEAVMKKVGEWFGGGWGWVSGVMSAAGVEAIAEVDLPAEKTLRQLLQELRVLGGREKGRGRGPPIATATPTPTSTPPTPTAPVIAAGHESNNNNNNKNRLHMTTSTTNSTAKQATAPAAVRLLVLDAVQDPGNLGSLARSALAFGWDGLFLLPGCCDPFNDKALRSSRGALLRLPTVTGDLVELLEVAEEVGLVLLCADMEEEEEVEEEADVKGGEYGREEESGDLLTVLHQQGRDAAVSRIAGGYGSYGGCAEGVGAVGMEPGWRGLCRSRAAAEEEVPASQGAPWAGGVALVLGSEGGGLSADVRRVCAPISVPMEGAMESLNVGVAGGVLMFAISSGPPVLFRKLATRLEAGRHHGGGGGGSGSGGGVCGGDDSSGGASGA
ncbi:hypothetical protein VOLCADRAFT_99057 [Volvox carteri f. nagariensis]|uniref:tRNA/rRNA methyltransferase SpoU type domain-containing protein n=1 Tax=Volvox carteri f. nagariensis TaxID=3068 RepID=D8UGY1_VOLCA|nr:uncharacterized protein VOLCADRAFT_99057 [Volvox carteri f. nagariensis]EFJ41030.1 hypothetical protein VOLCADRAFT_99057 [Volvox carteri f. nagariensis]|eukprot:XP_002957894.1 hypothetical protein VOLCADRAFT_99057 [Volvox carteri f. nagariensis]